MQMDPSNLHRDLYDLSTTPPRRMSWRDTNGVEAVMNGRGRYVFVDEWERMSSEERRNYPKRFYPAAPHRPHNPGTRKFNPADRMGHPQSGDGMQGLHRWIWDLAPDDGGEPLKVLMEIHLACESIERGRGRYCFAESHDATPPRADAEATS